MLLAQLLWALPLREQQFAVLLLSAELLLVLQW
jgi:hypothetical protein